jgi:hypothetical protein
MQDASELGPPIRVVICQPAADPFTYNNRGCNHVCVSLQMTRLRSGASCGNSDCRFQQRCSCADTALTCGTTSTDTEIARATSAPLYKACQRRDTPAAQLVSIVKKEMYPSYRGGYDSLPPYSILNAAPRSRSTPQSHRGGRRLVSRHASPSLPSLMQAQ